MSGPDPLSCWFFGTYPVDQFPGNWLIKPKGGKRSREYNWGYSNTDSLALYTQINRVAMNMWSALVEQRKRLSTEEVLVNRTLHHAPGVCCMTLLLISLILAACGGAQTQRAQRAPATPTEVELHANSDSSITISWQAAAAPTSYRIYRGPKPRGAVTHPTPHPRPPTHHDSNP